jgi:homoserine O-acetyltransferase
MSKVITIPIPNFTTDSGSYYNEIELHYQHFGRDYNDSPVILINHSLTGDANVAGSSGWWNEIVGPNLTIDTNKYAILAFNIPGNGVITICLKTIKIFMPVILQRYFIKD